MSPVNAALVVSAGAVDLAMEAMRAHSSRDAVQIGGLSLLGNVTKHVPHLSLVVAKRAVRLAVAAMHRFGPNRTVQILGLLTVTNIAGARLLAP